MTDTENDTQAELAAWELLAEARRERDEIRDQLREEQQLHTLTLDELDEARLALLSQMAREHLTCGWCGDMMHAPPGFTPPMNTEKLKLTVKLHMLDCPQHPIRETERDLEELRSAIRNLRDVKGRHHTQQATEALFNLLP